MRGGKGTAAAVTRFVEARGRFAACPVCVVAPGVCRAATDEEPAIGPCGGSGVVTEKQAALFVASTPGWPRGPGCPPGPAPAFAPTAPAPPPPCDADLLPERAVGYRDMLRPQPAVPPLPVPTAPAPLLVAAGAVLGVAAKITLALLATL